MNGFDLSLPPITWVDVARRLSAVTRRGFDDDILLAPPDGVLATEVFWSGLTVTLALGRARPDALRWLERLFPSRIEWDEDAEEGAVKLDAPPDLERLTLTFEVDEASVRKTEVFRPTAALEGRRSFDVAVPERPADPLPVFAFHSVKGGVGRTITAVAFTRHLVRELKKPVLLVDADFEAPGLSYLLASRKPESAISFEDMLVLAHADPDDDLHATLDFIATRLQEQRIDDLVVLPVKRSMTALSTFAIRPEHIVSARKGRPFLIVDMIRKIAAHLGCGAVVMDLRAGLVEIAMQLLTDPSVERVFVTTTSGQSLQATCGMLGALGMVERETGSVGRKPLMVINQVPAFLIADRRFVDEITGEIEAAAINAFQATASHAPVDASVNEVEFGSDSPLAFAILPHTVDLVRTSRDWDEFLTQIEASGFTRGVESQIRSWSALDALSRADKAAHSSIAVPTVHPALGRKEACRLLENFARLMVVAESASERLETPLVTPPLRRLGEDFQKHSPIAVIEGAKGTGKTLTFRFLVEQETWRDALIKLQGQMSPEIEGPIIPVYGSTQGERMVPLISERTRTLAQEFGSSAPMPFSELKRDIEGRLKENITQSQWADFWLDAIGWMCGIEVGVSGSWRSLLVVARDRKNHPIALFEGLEEVIFDPYADPKQADALRALLVDVPLRLRQEVGRPVGSLIFVRGDMVEAVIRQNLAQFRAGYRNYALTWSSIDILELVVWLATSSRAIPDLWTSSWREKSDDERANDLERIWGWKLGSEKSREARSTEWVLAVLTDLNGRLTARDLVRFIETAAHGSIDEEPADERLLAPAAMRRAVAATSEAKVKEYPSEVSVLLPIFERLQRTPGVETPLDQQTAMVVGLNDTDLTNLVKYGVFFEDNGQFEVPELFRLGLGFGRKGARPNIISLTRRALEKARLSG
jgi:MinD-like ATPase involved in chromosome partitioning or flagellar assembly